MNAALHELRDIGDDGFARETLDEAVPAKHPPRVVAARAPALSDFTDSLRLRRRFRTDPDPSLDGAVNPEDAGGDSGASDRAVPGQMDGSDPGDTDAAQDGGDIFVDGSVPLDADIPERDAGDSGPKPWDCSQSFLGKIASVDVLSATAWVKVNSGAHPVRLTVKTTIGGVDTYTSIAAVTAGTDAWTRITGAATFGWTTEPTALELYFEGPPAGVNVLVDDFTLRPLTSP